jgi:hypothetical protein
LKGGPSTRPNHALRKYSLISGEMTVLLYFPKVVFTNQLTGGESVRQHFVKARAISFLIFPNLPVCLNVIRLLHFLHFALLV